MHDPIRFQLEVNLIEIEFERLLFEWKNPTRLQLAGRMVWRIWMRSWRIALGFIIMCLAFGLASQSLDVFTRPIASLTLLGLLWGFVSAFLALAAFGLAWSSAFGPAPTEEEQVNRLRRQATAQVRLQDAAAETAARDQRQRESARSFVHSLGKFVGRMLSRR